MYKTYFHLKRRPFEISPDPSMFYATTQHQEALAGLFYGIKAGKGFMVLTGEVGTGKTLVVRCLQELLEQKRVSYAFVFNPRLSSREFLSYVAQDLGLSPCPAAKSDLLLGLSRLLIERHRHGITMVLVVEEAQHLTPVVLEEIRLLTNLESAQGKLLQILLIGQPELARNIAVPQMKQLRQRITLWFRLSVLSEEETSNYVQYRLKLAGDESGKIFAPGALEQVYRCSVGIPRLINTLCDNAMMSAATLCRENVTGELIERAASDLGISQADGNEDAATRQVQWQAGEITDAEMGGFPVVSETIGPEAGFPPKEEGL
jgi:general secretion pathway protein A